MSVGFPPLCALPRTEESQGGGRRHLRWHIAVPRTTIEPVQSAERSRLIGRNILLDEEASPNYRMRQVERRRTGEVSWEVIEASSGQAIATGLPDREEALRIIRGWERLSQMLEGGLAGHVLIH